MIPKRSLDVALATVGAVITTGAGVLIESHKGDRRAATAIDETTFTTAVDRTGGIASRSSTRPARRATTSARPRRGGSRGPGSPVPATARAAASPVSLIGRVSHHRYPMDLLAPHRRGPAQRDGRRTRRRRLHRSARPLTAALPTHASLRPPWRPSVRRLRVLTAARSEHAGSRSRSPTLDVSATPIR